MLISWSWSQRNAGRIIFIPGSEILPDIYNLKKKGTKTVIPRVDTAPQGGITSTPLRLAGVREVPPHPGRIRTHPWFINHFIHLQTHQTTAENDSSPRRYRSVRCGNLNPTGRVLIGWDSWSQRHPGRIRSHPRTRNPSIHLKLQETGDEIDGSPCSTSPRTVWKSQPLWPIADWRGFVEPAPPAEDKVPSPDDKCFHTSTTRTNQGRKQLSAGKISAGTLWKPQLRVHNCWLGFVKPAVPTQLGQQGSANSLSMTK